MEDRLWPTLKVIQEEYTAASITRQERNLKMIDQIVNDCQLVDKRKDKRVLNVRTNTYESIIKEAKRLGYKETVEDLFNSLKI